MLIRLDVREVARSIIYAPLAGLDIVKLKRIMGLEKNCARSYGVPDRHILHIEDLEDTAVWYAGEGIESLRKDSQR